MSRKQLLDNLRTNLDVLDERTRKDTLSRGSMLGYVMRSFNKRWNPATEPEGVVEWIQQTCRPLLPSRKESQRAAQLLLRWITA